MNRESAFTIVTGATFASGNKGTWTYSGPLPPSFNEVIVRQITYLNVSGQAIIPYIIYCDLTTQPLGSIYVPTPAATLPFQSTPNTRITNLRPFTNQINFQLMKITGGPPTTTVTGDVIVLTLEFITYKNA